MPTPYITLMNAGGFYRFKQISRLQLVPPPPILEQSARGAAVAATCAVFT